MGKDLFRYDQHSDQGDPDPVRHAANEQQGHQQPTAAEAISAVGITHIHGTKTARMPFSHRRTAFVQANLFQRRRNIDSIVMNIEPA